jgi:hypothetical protein
MNRSAIFFAVLSCLALWLLPLQEARAQYSEAELCYYFNICPPPPPPSDWADDADDVVQSPYYLRSGDLNGDSKRDFLVTGANVLRRVQDFLVMSSGSGYQVILNFSGSQWNTTHSWPVNSAPVSRVDIDLDGYFDLVLSEVTEGGDPIVVLTSNAGYTPSTAVVVNDAVRQAAAEITNAVLDPSGTLAAFDQVYSYTDWYWVWIPWPCAYWDYPYYGDCGYWVPYQYTVYYYGSDYFTPTARDFINSNRGALANGSLTSAFNAAAIAPGAAAVLGAGEAILTSPLAMRIGLFALRFAVVAVIPAAPAVLTAVLVGVAVYQVWGAVSEAMNDSPPSDIGPVPGTTPANPDPFEPCNRNTSAPQQYPPPGSSSDTIRKYSKRNLENVGCAKPHPDAEDHHTIPINQKSGGVGDRLREWARARGVDLADEANNVWLPKNTNVRTNAPNHNYDLHSRPALEEVERRLAQLEAQGYAPKDALRTVSNEIGSGNFHW